MRKATSYKTKRSIPRLFQVKHPVWKLLFTLVYVAHALLRYRFGVGCPYKRIFGIPCFGCGLTRAALASFQLDFKAAFQAHFMFWSIPILYGYVWFDGKIVQRKGWNIGILASILFGFVAQWLVQIL